MKLLNVIELDVCESTNDEAWKYVPKGNDEGVADFCPTVVLTHRQNKGRGRQGRAWESESEGNIMVSLAMAAPEKNLSWLPLAAGVAAAQALVHACEIAGCTKLEGLHLKWPNDVMWEGAKMGGILCESRFAGERAIGAVVGFGLNVVAAPVLEGLRTSSVLEHVLKKRDLSPTLVAAMRWFLIREWALRLLDWTTQLSEGRTEKLRQTWKTYAQLERFPELKVHDREGALVKLKALDLSEDGKLRARTADEGKIVLLDQADTIG